MPEGTTDASFLWNILYRTAFQLIADASAEPITIGENPYFFWRKSNDLMSKIICDNRDAFDLFVIHSDASNTARKGIIANIAASIAAAAHELCEVEEFRLVPLVATREMESWALADRDALARACGYDMWPPTEEVFWNESRLESVPDPKAIFHSVLDRLVGVKPNDRGERTHDILRQVSDTIDLERLGRLESYAQFRKGMAGSLEAMGILTKRT
jgi:hypothetical protein